MSTKPSPKPNPPYFEAMDRHFGKAKTAYVDLLACVKLDALMTGKALHGQ